MPGKTQTYTTVFTPLPLPPTPPPPIPPCPPFPPPFSPVLPGKGHRPQGGGGVPHQELRKEPLGLARKANPSDRRWMGKNRIESNSKRDEGSCQHGRVTQVPRIVPGVTGPFQSGTVSEITTSLSWRWRQTSPQLSTKQPPPHPPPVPAKSAEAPLPGAPGAKPPSPGSPKCKCPAPRASGPGSDAVFPCFTSGRSSWLYVRTLFPLGAWLKTGVCLFVARMVPKRGGPFLAEQQGQIARGPVPKSSCGDFFSLTYGSL